MFMIITFTDFLIWNELHFPWFAQIRSGPHIPSAPVVSACAALHVQSSVATGVRGTDVDPTQRPAVRQPSGYFSLALLIATVIPTSNHRADCSHGQHRLCPIHFDSEIHRSLCFFPERDYLSNSNWSEWEE